ncbi:MAG TPA: site-specific DNA-methyltransferase [bacterium]|nr:site-specific DNA-methyltransferase [bacterium]HPN44183.1 site-specific DNA-methyltransferase [bacterium]
MSNYTIHKADALEFLRDLPTGSVDFFVTDPPYSSGGAFRDDRAKSTSEKYALTGTEKQYANFGGDCRDQLSFYYWCALWYGQALRVLKPGAIACVFTDWRQLPVTINAMQIGGLVWRGIMPWNKSEAARLARGRFRAQCEYIVWASAGQITARTQACLPGFFTYPVVGKDKLHQTGKPLELMVDICKIAGSAPVTVCDPFMGSGTTGAAALMLGHRFWGCEIDAEIFALAEKRLQEMASKQHLFGYKTGVEYEQN